MGSSKKPKKIIVSYWYGATMQFGLCYGPVDAVTEVRVADRTAWSGSQTVSGDIDIDKTELFGGKSKEGGIDGTLSIKMGEASQSTSGFPGPSPVPAYRGVLCTVFRGFFAAGNPYLKPWAFQVRRILKGWNNDVAWYPEKAEITLGGIKHANPAHIIYESLTNPEWGMGYPTTSMDDAAFRAAALALHGEGFGISLTWNQQGSIQQFIGEILDHCHGVVRNNPVTGQFVLKLIRDDYDAEALDIFDEDDIIQVEEYTRASWGETVNEITVKFVEQTNGKVTAITVHDLANIAAQGGTVISRTQQYEGIPTFGLANRVAMRDLKMSSSPIARFRFTINRRAWDKLPADVIKLRIPSLGVNDVVVRVMDVGIGSLESNVVTISAVEDVFAIPDASYVGQNLTGWTDPATTPLDSPFVYLTEASYWTITRLASRADLDYMLPDDCFLTVLSQKANADATGYGIWSKLNADPDYEIYGGTGHVPIAYLSGDIGYAETTIPFDSVTAIDVDSFEGEGYAYVAAADGSYEMIHVTSVSTNSLTCIRAIGDTVPVPHLTGARIIFADGFEGSDDITYLPGEVVNVKIRTRTGLGTLPIASATARSYTFAGRQAKPYPPGNLRIDGQYWPAYIVGDFEAAWSHRDRLQQTAGIPTAQTAGDIGPEPGVTYSYQLKDRNGTPIKSITGDTGTSYTVTMASEGASTGGGLGGRVTFEIWAETIDGGASWQKAKYTVDRAGYGLNYGLYYGAGV